MIVRRLTPVDVPAYIALRREMLRDSPWAFAASESSDAGLDAAGVARNLETESYAIIGGFEGERLVGAAGLRRAHHPKLAHRADIWGVYVTPSARGKGCATAIIASALDVARSWPGVDSVRLSASVRSRGAIRVYERAGFKAWGLEPGYMLLNGEHVDEVHMVCML